MNKLYEPTLEQENVWKEWVESLPESAKQIAERFTPWTLYRLKPTGQYVMLRSFFENGTMSVDITGKYNVILFDRCVFGINPDDLEAVDVPKEEGRTILTHEEVDENIDLLRVMHRPDLFTMGADGKAKRRGSHD